MITNSKKILRVEHLQKDFPLEPRKLWNQDQKMIHAVDNLSFHINQGETLAVVGESGCGKTTLGKTILQISKPTSGKIYFDDTELTRLPEKKLRQLRSRMQMIFQDPYSSLNPRMPVGEIIAEGLRIQNQLDENDIERRIQELMDLVALNPCLVNRYPHEFSSGQRQRVGIARAISLNPEFIICDEPISALDISIQAQIINLLLKLQNQFGLTYMYITHDLAMVQYISDRVAVMYMGKFMEMGVTQKIFTEAVHPYTQALLTTVLMNDRTGKKHTGMIPIVGEKPDPQTIHQGCKFQHQCPIAMDICTVQEPESQQLAGDHTVACHRI